jgi:hypothetical protein
LLWLIHFISSILRPVCNVLVDDDTTRPVSHTSTAARGPRANSIAAAPGGADEDGGVISVGDSDAEAPVHDLSSSDNESKAATGPAAATARRRAAAPAGSDDDDDDDIEVGAGVVYRNMRLNPLDRYTSSRDYAGAEGPLSALQPPAQQAPERRRAPPLPQRRPQPLDSDGDSDDYDEDARPPASASASASASRLAADEETHNYTFNLTTPLTVTVNTNTAGETTGLTARTVYGPKPAMLTAAGATALANASAPPRPPTAAADADSDADTGPTGARLVSAGTSAGVTAAEAEVAARYVADAAARRRSVPATRYFNEPVCAQDVANMLAAFAAANSNSNSSTNAAAESASASASAPTTARVSSSAAAGGATDASGLALAGLGLRVGTDDGGSDNSPRVDDGDAEDANGGDVDDGDRDGGDLDMTMTLWPHAGAQDAQSPFSPFRDEAMSKGAAARRRQSLLSASVGDACTGAAGNLGFAFAALVGSGASAAAAAANALAGVDTRDADAVETDILTFYRRLCRGTQDPPAGDATAAAAAAAAVATASAAPTAQPPEARAAVAALMRTVTVSRAVLSKILRAHQQQPAAAAVAAAAAAPAVPSFVPAPALPPLLRAAPQLPRLTAAVPVAPCFLCHRPGHHARECPTPPFPLNTCSLCGHTGHDAGACIAEPCGLCLGFGHHKVQCRATKAGSSDEYERLIRQFTPPTAAGERCRTVAQLPSAGSVLDAAMGAGGVTLPPPGLGVVTPSPHSAAAAIRDCTQLTAAIESAWALAAGLVGRRMVPFAVVTANLSGEKYLDAGVSTSQRYVYPWRSEAAVAQQHKQQVQQQRGRNGGASLSTSTGVSANSSNNDHKLPATMYSFAAAAAAATAAAETEAQKKLLKQQQKQRAKHGGGGGLLAADPAPEPAPLARTGDHGSSSISSSSGGGSGSHETVTPEGYPTFATFSDLLDGISLTDVPEPTTSPRAALLYLLKAISALSASPRLRLAVFPGGVRGVLTSALGPCRRCGSPLHVSEACRWLDTAEAARARAAVDAAAAALNDAAQSQAAGSGTQAAALTELMRLVGGVGGGSRAVDSAVARLRCMVCFQFGHLTCDGDRGVAHGLGTTSAAESSAGTGKKSKSGRSDKAAGVVVVVDAPTGVTVRYSDFTPEQLAQLRWMPPSLSRPVLLPRSRHPYPVRACEPSTKCNAVIKATARATAAAAAAAATAAGNGSVPASASALASPLPSPAPGSVSATVPAQHLPITAVDSSSSSGGGRGDRRSSLSALSALSAVASASADTATVTCETLIKLRPSTLALDPRLLTAAADVDSGGAAGLGRGCVNCGSDAHSVSACTWQRFDPLAPENLESSSAGGGAGMQRCFRCQRLGHQASACPSGYRGGNNSNSNNSIGAGRPSWRDRGHEREQPQQQNTRVKLGRGSRYDDSDEDVIVDVLGSRDRGGRGGRGRGGDSDDDDDSDGDDRGHHAKRARRADGSSGSSRARSNSSSRGSSALGAHRDDENRRKRPQPAVHRRDEGHSRDGSSSGGGGMRLGGSDVQCHRCGEWGHIKSQCPTSSVMASLAGQGRHRGGFRIEAEHLYARHAEDARRAEGYRRSAH